MRFYPERDCSYSHRYIFIERFDVVLKSDWLGGLSNHEIFPNITMETISQFVSLRFTAFLTASVIADTKIHYNFRNTVVVLPNVVLRVFR